MENTREHFVRVYTVDTDDAYNRFVSAGWRFITDAWVVDECGKRVSYKLGWPEGSGEPVYPDAHDVKFY